MVKLYSPIKIDPQDEETVLEEVSGNLFIKSGSWINVYNGKCSFKRVEEYCTPFANGWYQFFKDFQVESLDYAEKLLGKRLKEINPKVCRNLFADEEKQIHPQLFSIEQVKSNWKEDIKGKRVKVMTGKWKDYYGRHDGWNGSNTWFLLETSCGVDRKALTNSVEILVCIFNGKPIDLNERASLARSVGIVQPSLSPTDFFGLPPKPITISDSFIPPAPVTTNRSIPIHDEKTHQYTIEYVKSNWKEDIKGKRVKVMTGKWKDYYGRHDGWNGSNTWFLLETSCGVDRKALTNSVEILVCIFNGKPIDLKNSTATQASPTFQTPQNRPPLNNSNNFYTGFEAEDLWWRLAGVKPEECDGDSTLVREKLKESDAYYDSIMDLAKWSATHGSFKIVSIERITNKKLEASFKEVQKEMKNPDVPSMRLYHGTSVEGVEGIIRQGFRQPKIGTTDKKTGKPPMYGYGVYFAKNVTKSAQSVYTQGSGMVLVCDVLIGQNKREETAQNHYTLDIVRKMGYDSVWAPGGTDVMNHEYVIYDARQAIPRYIIHFTTTTASINQDRGLRRVGTTILKSDIFNSINQNSAYPEWKYSEYMKASGLFNTLHTNKEVVEVQVINNGELKRKFEAKREEFRKRNLDGIAFVFHGTQEQNLECIAEEGFKNPRTEDIISLNGQVYGAGMYFADNPFTSEGYTKGCNKMLVCKILPGNVHKGTGNPIGYNSNHVGAIRVIYDADQILPIYIIKYQ